MMPRTGPHATAACAGRCWSGRPARRRLVSHDAGLIERPQFNDDEHFLEEMLSERREQMAHRSSRHRIRPIAALALEAGTTIGPRCANVHLGPEDQRLHKQAGYTTAPDPVETLLATPRSTSGRSPYTGC